MRRLPIYLSFFLSISILCASLVPLRIVEQWENAQIYSIGIASDRRLIPFSEESQDETLSSMWESDTESLPDDLVEESDEQQSIFAGEGSFSCTFDGVEKAADRLGEKIIVEEDADYLKFAFADCSLSVGERLTDEEVCLLLYQVIDSCTLNVPIRGRLERIVIAKRGEELLISAEIEADFSSLIEKVGLDWLPEKALFCLFVPFCVKNSEISADSERVILRCKSFDLPEILLMYGCGVAFGRKDYKEFFASTVRNVFVNAGIYR